MSVGTYTIGFATSVSDLMQVILAKCQSKESETVFASKLSFLGRTSRIQWDCGQGMSASWLQVTYFWLLCLYNEFIRLQMFIMLFCIYEYTCIHRLPTLVLEQMLFCNYK